MSSAHKPAPTNRAAEELLASLAGIVSAHVVADEAGRFVEVHVLCAPDIHPKQVVRNVESALTAGLGLHIDRRVVSVAQIRSSLGTNGQPADGELPAPVEDLLAREDSPADHVRPAAHRGDAGRVEFVRFEAHRDAERCRCNVTLRAAENEIVGTGWGADTAPGRAEAAARAVLDALGQARPGVRVALDGAVVSAARGHSFVIVAAHVLLDRGLVPLAGAAPLHRSPEEAGILAALQATNRWSA